MQPLTFHSGKPKFDPPPGLASVGVMPEDNYQDSAEMVAEQEGFHKEGPSPNPNSYTGDGFK